MTTCDYAWLRLQTASSLSLFSDLDEFIGGAEGATFLRRSLLTTDQLREVWRLASGGVSKPKLDKSDWLVACKIVAVVQQKGGEPNLLAAVGPGAVNGLADFGYGQEPDIEGGELPLEVSASSIRVTVSNPTTFGSGLGKHTRYNVVTSTSLEQVCASVSVYNRAVANCSVLFC